MRLRVGGLVRREHPMIHFPTRSLRDKRQIDRTPSMDRAPARAPMPTRTPSGLEYGRFLEGERQRGDQQNHIARLALTISQKQNHRRVTWGI